jgi:hypothetical protein
MNDARTVARGALIVSFTIALLASCVRVEDFFFAGQPADAYRWDEIDPSIDGDLSSPHPSLVPAALREEGFVRGNDDASLHWVPSL